MSEERPWENTSEVPQRFQEVAAGNENAGPFQPSKAHHHAENQELERGNSKADNPAGTSLQNPLLLIQVKIRHLPENLPRFLLQGLCLRKRTYWRP